MDHEARVNAAMKSSVRAVCKFLLPALAVASCVLLISCEEQMVPASVGGYNHMNDESISSFTVDSAGGPNLGPESGNSGSSCCASIPKRWRPGMKANVTWSYGSGPKGSRPPPPDQETVVEIPEYSAEAGSLHAHFYPNHRVKLVVSPYGIGHPRYPMSDEDKLPWETRKELIEYEKKNGRTQ